MDQRLLFNPIQQLKREIMKEVIGIENLKNEFRKAKLICGDLRGLKNRFALSAELGVSSLQTFYHSVGGNGKIRMELTADCYSTSSDRCIYEYTMSGLVEEIKDETESFEVHLICLEWNKQRSDAKRREVSQFIYKPVSPLPPAPGSNSEKLNDKL